MAFIPAQTLISSQAPIRVKLQTGISAQCIERLREYLCEHRLLYLLRHRLQCWKMLSSLIAIQNLNMIYYFCVTAYLDVSVRETSKYTILPIVQLQKSQF